MNWLLVGTGDIVGKRVGDALKSAAGSKLVGVCGGAGRAEAIAETFGAKEVFHDVSEALEKTSADAVYVATAVFRHGDEAIRAINAGKPVLIEKPLGLDGRDAARIVEASAEYGVTAGCAFYRRCFPRYTHLRELIDSGKLGAIVGVRMCYWSWGEYSRDDHKYWRVEKSKSGGGPLMDMGSHMFDQLIGLFGLPRQVFARCDTLAQDYEVEDSSAVVMTLDNGALVSADIGWNSRTWRHEIEVIGTEGKVLWFPADTGTVVVTIGRDIEERELPNADNVHVPLVEDFANAVAEGHDPVCPVSEAARTNQLLDAIYQSADEGRMIELPAS